MKKKQVAVIGSGNMGTALVQVITDNNYEVKIWSIEQNVLKEINSRHTNKKYLPKVKLSKNIEAVFSVQECIEGAEIIILAVPSNVIRRVVNQIKSSLKKNQILVNIAKGLEEKTGMTMHEVILSELGRSWYNNILVLSGPSVATEFVRRKFAVVDVAGATKAKFTKLQQILGTEYFKLVYSKDVLGTELGGTIKNIYAIAMGMCDGMNYTNNTQAILMVMALKEMKVLYKKLGADPNSVYGLAGLGDFLVTSLSEFGRNRTLGERICAYKSYAKAAKSMKQVTEGVIATKVIYKIAKKKKLNLPLLNLVYKVLFTKVNPCQAIEKFLRTMV